MSICLCTRFSCKGCQRTKFKPDDSRILENYGPFGLGPRKGWAAKGGWAALDGTQKWGGKGGLRFCQITTPFCSQANRGDCSGRLFGKTNKRKHTYLCASKATKAYLCKLAEVLNLQMTSGSSWVHNRFICGLQAVHQQDEKRVSFLE